MSVPSGWYPDPGGSEGRYRYWDGKSWTGSTTSDPGGRPPSAGGHDAAHGSEPRLRMAGRIFISYRRADSSYPAGWLYERLANHFGRDDVVRDIDSIDPGDDFVEVIERAVASCDVMLAVIGTRWVSVVDEEGRRRLDDEEDFVRREIEAALNRNIRVIPVLVDGAAMPRRDELPFSLVKLSRRHALELSSDRFQQDVDRLLQVLDRTVAQEQREHRLVVPDPVTTPASPSTQGEDLVWSSGDDRGDQRSSVIAGRYEIVNLLGHGRLAELHRAVDRRLGRGVVVRQLRAELAGDAASQAQFRREVQLVAGLRHPRIVAAYDTGEELDRQTGFSVPYVVMELVDGSTLQVEIEGGLPPLRRALGMISGVLDALSYSHESGVLHLNLKPANVMLDRNGDVKVKGFTPPPIDGDVTKVIGTVEYLSPEQCRGQAVSAQSDLYSAGCLMYELLVGQPPFVGESPVSVAYQHVRQAPVRPSQLVPEITRAVDTVVLKALAKEPSARYESARAMNDDITRLTKP